MFLGTPVPSFWIRLRNDNIFAGELKKHMKEKENGKMFECRKCHALFSEAEMLNNHLMSDKHSGKAFFTVRKRSCWKLMFSQASVILSGGCLRCEGQGMHWGGGCVRGGGRGACVVGETATAADGTYPTGMNSCFQFNFDLTLLRLSERTQQK